MFIWATLTCCCIGTICVINIVWGPDEWTIPFVGEDIWIGRDVVVFCNSRLCRFQFNSIQCQVTPAVSLMGRVIHRLWVSYLLRKSDDEHIDNTVEEKVRDWDPVLKKWYWYYFSTWIGTGFLTSRSLQSCVTTTQMYLALRAMVTNIQLIRRQLFLRIIFETWFLDAYI